MTDFNDLFNPTGAVPQESQRTANEFRPDPRKGKNGVYSAIVRFVVNPANTSKCYVTKLQAYVVNPVTQQGIYVDDPRSGGMADSPVNKMYWSLKNTKRANLEDLADKCLSTKLKYASLVQIIQDPQNPENVGKILPWVYGKKIYDKLINEQNPPMDGMVSYNPFDPVNGRYFSLKVVQQGGFPNYDQCQFIDYRGANGETSGLWFMNPNTGKTEICTANTDRKMFYEYLVQNAPDLSEYEFKEWTPRIQEHVDTVLKLIGTYVTTGSFGENVSAAQPSMMQNSNPAPAPTMGGINFGGAPQPVVAPTPVMNPMTESGTGIPSSVPNVTGIEIPDVASALPNIEPVNAPSGNGAPMFGDLSSVFANM